MKLTKSADKIGVLRWYVDTSYMVHDGCSGHTGAMLTMGKGAIMSFSCQLELNGKSSTESELIRVDGFIL